MTCISLFFSSYILFYSKPEWTDILRDVEVDEFREVVGPTTPLTPDTSVLSLFQMFFTTALMGSIVEQTNAYALLVLGENPRWTDFNDTDIWAFLRFCILMGINRLPALHHYWSANPLFHYHPIAERISQDRFLSILRFLHFVDNQRSALPQGTVPMVDQSHHKVSMVDHSHHKVPMVDISHQLHQIPIVCGRSAQ